MKLLLYCTKGDKNTCLEYADNPNKNEEGKWYITSGYPYANGKIIGECDYDVEEILFNDNLKFETKTLNQIELCQKSCLSAYELDQYLPLYLDLDKVKNVYGYAIHIRNLHIFDEPRDFSEFSKKVEHCKCDKCLSHCKYYYAKNNITQTTNTGCTKYTMFYTSPHNMMYVYDLDEKKVLISIRPKWMCKILNGEKTVEIRKKVLKEMLKND